MLHFMTICINVTMENLLQVSIFVMEYMIVVLIMLVMRKTAHVPHLKNQNSGNANLSSPVRNLYLLSFLFCTNENCRCVLLFQNLQTQ